MFYGHNYRELRESVAGKSDAYFQLPSLRTLQCMVSYHCNFCDDIIIIMPIQS